MLKVIPGNAQHIGAQDELWDSFSFSSVEDEDLAAHGGVLAAIAEEVHRPGGCGQSSSGFVESFRAAYSNKAPAETVSGALLRSFREANHALAASAEAVACMRQIIAKFAAAAVYGNDLYWISSGKGLIYLLRRGRLSLVNSDGSGAKKGWRPVATGIRKPKGNLRHSLSDEFRGDAGISGSLAVNMAWQPLRLQSLDVVIVCSGGVTSALNEDEIIASFRHTSASEGCKAVEKRALDKRIPNQDNLTILAMQCREVPISESCREDSISWCWKPSLSAAAVLGLILGTVLSYQFPPADDGSAVSAVTGLSRSRVCSPSPGCASHVPSGTTIVPQPRSKPSPGHRFVPPPSSMGMQPTQEIQNEPEGPGRGAPNARQDWTSHRPAGDESPAIESLP